MCNQYDSNIFSKFVKFGFKNLNLLGFSAFGCDEDSTNFTKYGPEDNRFAGKTYFNLNTSEDLCAESNILKYWSETNKINFIENYTELTSALEKKMTLNKNNFLDKIKKATIHNEPFEHLVVDNLLPGDFYNKLSEDFFLYY